MTWHSSARATPGGLYNALGVVGALQTVVVVPTVPFGKEYGNKRIVCVGTPPGQESLFNGQTPAMQAREITGAALTAADLAWFLVDADGVRWPIRSETIGFDAENPASDPNDAILMIEEGERIEVDVSAESGAPSVDVLAQWLDVQGPVKFSRVVLTDAFQEIVPAADPGKSHTPLLSLIGADVANFSYTLASTGAVASGIDVARAKNGAPGATQVGVVAAAPATYPPITAGLAGPIKAALGVGDSIVAKLSAANPGGDHVLVVPYLVTTNS
jgi:hypothetical protein